MLFERRLREGIADGTITVAVRRWRRPQAKAGGRYRTGLGIVVMDSVDPVTVDDLTEADAREAGHPSVAALLADVAGPADGQLYRLRFHRVDDPDPRAVLAADDDLSAADVAALTARLARLDTGPRGPWAVATLASIGRRPGVRAADLAAELARPDRLEFKADVRRLKALGLTESLPVGYRLTPRGRALLAALLPPAQPDQ